MQRFQNFNCKGSLENTEKKAVSLLLKPNSYTLCIMISYWYHFAGRGGRRHDGARALEAWSLQGVQNKEGGGDARQNGGERKVAVFFYPICPSYA